MDPDTMVYSAFSVTPQVFENFCAAKGAKASRGVSTGSFLLELQAMRNGHAELGWRLCNPFKDRRLALSLMLLSLHIVAVVVVLSCITAAVCFWTSRAAASSDPVLLLVGGRGLLPSPCGNTRRTDRELTRLLLSIDIPFFVCVAMAYCLAMANIVALSRRRFPVVLTGAVGAGLALAGSLIVAFGDPKKMWGTKGSVGFAGIWIVVQSLAGICTLVFGLSSGGPEQRLVKSKASAAGFGLIYLGSALALQGMYYLVEMLAASGMHAAVGIFLLFVATFCVLTCIKQSVRQWVRVPPLACTFMLYWFQAGSYMSFRLFLQAEEMAVLVVTTIAAALSETALRIGIAVTAKLMYNYYVRRKNAVMALRVLDVHIATLLVDILAEWAAIAIAGVLGAAVDSSAFDGLRIFSTPGGFATTMGLQVSVEVLADIASLVVAFTILPISLEGLFHAPGHWLLEISCIVASVIFVFSTLNMRVRIDCFSP